MAAPNAPSPPLIAVDTNVLIDLAAGSEVIVDCLATIRRRLPESPIFVLPTVTIELAGAAFRAADPKVRALATKALRQLRQPWGFIPLTCLPVGNGIVEETARKLRAAGLLPEEEVHGSFIVAEAALANVNILLSSDGHLLGVKAGDLRQILDRCDLAHTMIVSPRKIVTSFFN